MKALIWIVILFVPGLLITLLRKSGIYLGGIPTVLLYSLCFFIAKTLCARWEVYSLQKKASQSGMTPFEYAKRNIPELILERIESEKNHPEELKHYLELCVKNGSIDRATAGILIKGYLK